MFYPPGLLTWAAAVSRQMPHLSRSQAWVLALFSFATSVTQSCGMSHVACFLAELLGQSDNTVRQRLREWLYDAPDKRGGQRQQVVVERCFNPLLSWILELWDPDDAWLMLALDATTLRQTFTVLSVSVLVGRCAIPVAWAIVPATRPGAWRPHWHRLLRQIRFKRDDLTVGVLADRGLYAKWLFVQIVQQGWHPLLRVNAQGYCQRRGVAQRLALKELARQCRGSWWHEAVICFSGPQQLACTLLALSAPDQQQPWLLVTDLAPETVSPTWYGLRMWIEFGYKAVKSAGFHWERTRMTDAHRAERLWLVLALASLRALTLSPPAPTPVLSVRSTYPRLSLLKQGLVRHLARLIRQRDCPLFPLPTFSLPPSPCLEYLTQLKTYP